jgi:hypothetical protein
MAKRQPYVELEYANPDEDEPVLPFGRVAQ